MISLNHILSEQLQDLDKLNILFVGDQEIKERSSFAKRLLASRQITGEIKFTYKGNSDKILELLQSNIADNFDLVVFFCSGIYESREYNETIEKLNNIFSITFLTSGTYIYIILYDIFINKIITNNYIDYIRVIYYGSFIFIFAYTQNKLKKSN